MLSRSRNSYPSRASRLTAAALALLLSACSSNSSVVAEADPTPVVEVPAGQEEFAEYMLSPEREEAYNSVLSVLVESAFADESAVKTCTVGGSLKAEYEDGRYLLAFSTEEERELFSSPSRLDDLWRPDEPCPAALGANDLGVYHFETYDECGDRVELQITRDDRNLDGAWRSFLMTSGNSVVTESTDAPLHPAESEFIFWNRLESVTRATSDLPGAQRDWPLVIFSGIGKNMSGQVSLIPDGLSGGCGSSPETPGFENSGPRTRV
ncbi:MAG: hypothetical protein AAF413_04695 [Patescibacteria group bacterium]